MMTVPITGAVTKPMRVMAMARGEIRRVRTLAEPQERRRERGAHVHARHPADEHVLPGNLLAAIEARHGVLGYVEEPGDSPAEPDSRDQPDPLTQSRRHHRFILPRLALADAGF